MNSLIIFEVISSAASIGFAIFLHIRTDDWQLAVSAALGAEVLLHLFAFTIRYGAVLDGIREACPPEEKPHPLAQVRELAASAERFRGHSIPLRLLTNRPEEWCLQDRLEEVISQVQKDLADLEKKRFRVQMKDILEPSLRVCREIKQSAFCTALGKHTGIFMETERGRQLRRANYEAAGRLKDKGRFTRLFILQSVASLNPDIYELMSENHSNDIRVLVILRQEASEALKKNNIRRDSDDDLDFGLWDNSYKMTITGEENSRWMEVSAAKEDLEEAREMKRALEEAAYSWEEFCNVLKEPRNGPGSGWSSSPERILKLPPPNGPYPEDVAVMFDAAAKALANPGRLAILGLTHALIEKAKLLQAGGAQLEIEVVDCREYRPPAVEKGLTFRLANWLEWKPKNPFDAIVADDTLCNLGVWQIPLFFESVADALKPGGLFIVRTTAIYSPGIMHPRPEEIMKRLKELRPEIEAAFKGAADSESQSAVYELAWPVMHSAEFYDIQSHAL